MTSSPAPDHRPGTGPASTRPDRDGGGHHGSSRSDHDGDVGPAAEPAGHPDGERLQKVLAAAGVGSRRACEELIAAGRVAVDGEVVAAMGRRVDPRRAVIHVDGQRVVVDDTLVYLALNKPRGVVTAMSDDRGRPTVSDYVTGYLAEAAADAPGDAGADPAVDPAVDPAAGGAPDRAAGASPRVFHVGRLDADSEGLLLLTNDGTLAHRLTHPSYGVQKTYLAEVPGPLRQDVARRLRDGVTLDDGPVVVDRFRVVDQLPGRVLVEVVLHEGRNHIVRRLLAEVGHPVSRLVRTAVGPVRLGTLRAGAVRPLTLAEVGQLHAAVDL